MIRHLVFFIAYIYFLYNDFLHKEINIIAIGIYAIMSLFCIGIARDDMSMDRFVDLLFSVGFGLSIYILSYFSEEGIGIADGMFFVINGFVLTLKENIVLFFSGILVAFIIGIILLVCKNINKNRNIRIPFMPCILPAIIGYIICIV